MEIITFGWGGRLRTCERILQSRQQESKYKTLVLLPVPTSKDKRYITGTDIPLSDVSEAASDDSLVAGYELPEDISRELLARGAAVYDAGADEDFLIENAVLTAHGALGRILCDGARDISGLRIGVVGYGRIGRELVKLFLFLGACVRVFTTTPSTARELCEMGINATLISDDTDFSFVDIIVNTAPAHIFSEADLSESVKIYDLASGKIFGESKRVVKLASVPEVMYPESAGEIYARYILRELGRGGCSL